MGISPLEHTLSTPKLGSPDGLTLLERRQATKSALLSLGESSYEALVFHISQKYGVTENDILIATPAIIKEALVSMLGEQAAEIIISKIGAARSGGCIIGQ